MQRDKASLQASQPEEGRLGCDSRLDVPTSGHAEGCDELALAEALIPAPPGGSLVFFRKLTYGVHPEDLAEEVMRTVRRKKQEVFMANPIPKAAVYIRTFFPEFFFAVVACGVKDKLNVPEEG